MGRFLNRPYRNYSLFISKAASLFNIHSSPRIIPLAFPGNTVPMATFAGVHRTPLPLLFTFLCALFTVL